MTLAVAKKQIYDTCIDREIKSPLLLLAWGEGNQYDVKFNGITLTVGEPRT